MYELLWSTDWRYWKQIKNYLWFIFCKRPSLNSLNTPLKRCNIDCWLVKELLTLKCISKCETCPLFHSPGCTIQLQHHFVKCHIYLWCISICLRHITYLWYLYNCFFWDTWVRGTMESRVVWTVDLRNSLVLSCKKNPPETTDANTMMDLKWNMFAKF